MDSVKLRDQYLAQCESADVRPLSKRGRQILKQMLRDESEPESQTIAAMNAPIEGGEEHIGEEEEQAEPASQIKKHSMLLMT